ncbi:XkdX family protein [Lacrimispora sp. BS-2]|uniref:XkdX family protein n=1 Tax=Lacrimispora sp. BS-2 TaxID=3151850 RepID=A0AAU7PK41_9FIRM
MSKNFDKVKKFYDSGLWSEEMVRNAVDRWINADEFQEIVGKEYWKS